MALERRDPVPAGRYWLWVLPGELPRWQDWVHSNSDRVRVRLTEDSGEGVHTVFDVLSPVQWVGLGYPTIVPAGTLPSESQVVQAPEPEPTFEARLESALGEVKTVLLIAGGIWLAARLFSRRR